MARKAGLSGLRICAKRGDSPVEGDPFDIIKQDETASDEQLAKVVDVNPFLLVALEVDARVLEELDRVGSVHVVAEELVRHGWHGCLSRDRLPCRVSSRAVPLCHHDDGADAHGVARDDGEDKGHRTDGMAGK